MASQQNNIAELLERSGLRGGLQPGDAVIVSKGNRYVGEAGYVVSHGIGPEHLYVLRVERSAEVDLGAYVLVPRQCLTKVEDGTPFAETPNVTL